MISALFEDVHEPGAAEPAVVLQGDASALNLAAASFSAQLPGQFRNLCQSRCAKRMALGQQTAGRIDDDITTIGIGFPGDEVVEVFFGAQAECAQPVERQLI